MPYADPDVQREFHRQLFYVRYRTDPDFREAESYRKARWYQKNREKILEKITATQKKSDDFLAPARSTGFVVSSSAL